MEAILANGGTPACEEDVVRALDWLKSQQNEDGSWGENLRVHLTGLAVLAYLGHCETHESAQYGETVTRAVAYLTERALAHEGYLKGDYVNHYHHNAYGCVEHAIGTYALGEAMAMFAKADSPFPYARALKKAAREAVRFTLANQIQTGSFSWWSYGVENKSSRFDKSFRENFWLYRYVIHTSWNLQSLVAAKEAGLHIPQIQRRVPKGFEAMVVLQQRSPDLDGS